MVLRLRGGGGDDFSWDPLDLPSLGPASLDGTWGDSDPDRRAMSTADNPYAYGHLINHPPSTVQLRQMIAQSAHSLDYQSETVCVCVCVCVCVYVCVWFHVYLCIFMYIYVYTCWECMCSLRLCATKHTHPYRVRLASQRKC